MISPLYPLIAASLMGATPVTKPPIEPPKQIKLAEDYVCMMVFNPLTGKFSYVCVKVPLPIVLA